MEGDLLSKVLKLYGFIGMMAVLVTLLIFLFRYQKAVMENPDVLKSNKEIALEEQWDVYYNGQQVDINDVDLSLYECSYNKTDKKVFITDKKSSNSGGDGIIWFLLGRSLGW